MIAKETWSVMHHSVMSSYLNDKRQCSTQVFMIEQFICYLDVIVHQCSVRGVLLI